ncbi:MAG TPA: hypothetical protein VMS65_07515 [Polyangiaceae bacterium]|nr:hypothetical protein [Polyangiaceae bacterium]
MPLTAPKRVQALALLALFLGGCRSLEKFDTSGEAAYCGDLVGAELFQDGFIPDNTRPDLRLNLELDIDQLATRPGTLTSNDGATGLCSENGDPLFRNAPLRAIDQIFHDDLSQAEFGEGHQHDLFAWVDSTCQGTMVAVVSLLTNGAVEVRLMKPAPDPPSDASASERPGFAKFYLEKNNKGCTF